MSNPGTIRTGIVIVTHNSHEIIADAVATLLAHGDASSSRIWIVDSGSNLESASGRLDGVDRTVQAANYGYGTCVNVAVRGGLPGDWIVVLNPDAAITLEDIDALADIAEQNGLAILGPALTTDLDGGHFAAFPRPPWRLRTNPPEKTHATAPLAAVSSIQGSIMLIERAFFEQVGGFDETFFLYFEELDLCKRALASGREVAFAPSIQATHRGQSSSVGVLPTWRLAERIRGKHRFFSKHYSRPEASLATALDLLLLPPKTAWCVIRQLRRDPRKDLEWPAQGRIA